MANQKDILVITTSSVDGLKIKRYLKPVSSHIVAGTNVFSDFLGGLTDVFGGRSHSYQMQLTSLYNEAIERIKYSAYEIGANCIVGLTIDMDEISGKGKSMFMLTAIGTAVVIEKESSGKEAMVNVDGQIENIGVDRINMLRNKKDIIEKASKDNLNLTDSVWDFLIANQVAEIFPYLLKKYRETWVNGADVSDKFYGQILKYLDCLPEHKKIDLLYESIKNESHEQVASKLLQMVKELTLFDFNKSMALINDENFSAKKRGLQAVIYDKPFYNKKDIEDLQTIRKTIKEVFVERGTRTTKKQLLSSKEKDVWTCECGKTNDIGSYCSGCTQDIYGFKFHEIKPNAVDDYIGNKIELISEYLLNESPN